jgi:Ca2+/H+ antiporter
LAAARRPVAAACALHLLLRRSIGGGRRARQPFRKNGERDMLWTIFVILIVMWLLGMVSSYTMGGFIHLLLVLAIAVVLINIIQGRRPV